MHTISLSHAASYNFEMKKFTLSLCRDFTTHREVDVTVFLLSLINLGDASIKSSVLKSAQAAIPASPSS